jgi:hypothetical protein
MMTKAEWDRRESHRMKLSELLEQEPLKQALEVCLTMETDVPHHFVGSADLLHQAALSGAAREGYFRFFRNLKALTREPVAMVEMPRPWAKPTAPNS